MIEKTGANKPKTFPGLQVQGTNQVPANVEVNEVSQAHSDVDSGKSNILDLSEANPAQAMIGFIGGTQDTTSARVRGAQEGLDWVIKYFANKYSLNITQLQDFTEVLSSKEAEDRGIAMMLAAATGYYAPENVIIVNSAFEGNPMMKNPYTPKEEGAHEGYHGLEVFILSTKLTQQQRDNAIERSLINEARNGTSTSIVTPCALSFF